MDLPNHLPGHWKLLKTNYGEAMRSRFIPLLANVVISYIVDQATNSKGLLQDNVSDIIVVS